MAKLRYKIYIFVFISVLNNTRAWTQLTIDSITITDKPYSQKILKPDNSTDKNPKNTITDFLQSVQSGQLHLSTPGGLTSFLHRGMGHRHLSVQWQGVNIQNIINGSYDLSLVPIFLMGGTSFYTFGNPSIQGNNGFAGVLSLQSSKYDADRLKMYISASSLQNFGSGALYRFHNKKVHLEMGFDYGFDKNIFGYTYNNTRRKRSPSDFQHINITSNTTILISNNQSIRCNVWLQNAHRKIPVSSSAAFTDQRQADQNARAQVSYLAYHNQHKIQSTLTFMNENLDFKTPSIDSRSRINTWLANLQYTHLTKNEWYGNIQWRRDVATPNFYQSPKTRTSVQAAVSKQINWTDKALTQVSMRQDMVDGQFMPLSWNAHTKIKETALTINSNYNLPGLNDLYWPAGGNPKLKSEISHQMELKSTAKIKHFKLQAAIYAQMVSDWIQWLPGADGLFAPINQKKVLGTGIDLHLEKTYLWSVWKMKTSVYYTYNNTHAIDHYSDPALVGKQLIYVPQHKGGMSAEAFFKSHQCAFHYQYIGKRYDLPDQSRSLNPIHLVHFSYLFSFRKMQIDLQAKNLLNAQYEITRFFPMPGVHFNIQFIYHILNNNN